MKRLFLFLLFYSVIATVKADANKVISTNEKVSASVFEESKTLREIFGRINKKMLTGKSESEIKDYLLPFVSEVRDYVNEKYKLDLYDYYDKDDPTILAVAMMVALGERLEVEGIGLADFNLQNAKIPQWVKCLLEATGINSLVSAVEGVLGQIPFGAAEILQIIKRLGKKYLGWIGLALAIADFVDCMGWV